VKVTLPLRTGDEGPDQLNFRHELARKAIHLASVSAALAAYFLPRDVALVLFCAVALAAAAVEVARSRLPAARYFFLRRTRRLLRGNERRGLSGATYMAIGYLIAFVAFPTTVAVAAMLYNGVGDAAAAVFGKRWGRHRTSWGKSWEGALAGFAANFVAGLAVPGVSLVPALLGGAIAALIEILPLPLNDNLTVTLGGGLGLWAALTLMG
jgi:dolichol kinase